MRCEKCSDGQKRFNGCDEDSDIPERWKVREMVWQRCPLKVVTEQTGYFITAYSNLQKGVLPYHEGYNRNSNRYVEAMQIIENEVRTIEAENRRQARNGRQ